MADHYPLRKCRPLMNMILANIFFQSYILNQGMKPHKYTKVYYFELLQKIDGIINYPDLKVIWISHLTLFLTQISHLFLIGSHKLKNYVSVIVTWASFFGNEHFSNPSSNVSGIGTEYHVLLQHPLSKPMMFSKKEISAGMRLKINSIKP